MEQLLSKIEASKLVIKEAYRRHGHRLYIAYSGGKDSEALVKLATLAGLFYIIKVHNEHEGEVPGAAFPLLVTKAPKSSFKQFLDLVHLEAQIDGTRKDEDKTVIFNGKEIHRSEMPSPINEEGVFGLKQYYPLYDWNEQEIIQFLSNGN